MPITAELRARTGEKYTNDAGRECERYTQVGVEITKDGRRMLKIESLPVKFDGFIFFSEPRERAARPEPPAGLAPVTRPSSDDDIPF